MLFVLIKIRKVVCFFHELEFLIQIVFFIKLMVDFYPSIESNRLVEIQKYIYTKSFELS